jgi:hypothetical protein
MANTKDKVLDRAGGARPYIERALQDEDLRENVRNAFESARGVYNELIGGRGAIHGRFVLCRDVPLAPEVRVPFHP